jgi:hypothetical protein
MHDAPLLKTVNHMTLLEIAVKTLCDVRAKHIADAAFLFGQTKDNQDSVFSAARKIIGNRLAKKILIVKSGPKSGYPGYSVWTDELCKLGIPQDSIGGVDLEHAITLNTLIEAQGLITHAKSNRYQTIYVVASPLHQLRALMTAVTVALKFYPQLRIYSFCGAPLPWTETVAHSQGTTVGTRSDLIQAELGRIEKYQRKGDLADEISILAYLEKRDTGS